MIIKSKLIPKLLGFLLGNVVGVTIYPFIFIDPDYADDEVLINHEKIHLAQYRDLFVIGFVLLYVYDFLIGMYKYRDTQKAYRNIRLEKEAYQMQGDMSYLDYRKKYGWRDHV